MKWKSKQPAEMGTKFAMAAAAICALSGTACSAATTGDGRDNVATENQNLYYDTRAGDQPHWPAASDHPGSGRGADISVCYTTPGAVAGSADEQARIAFVQQVPGWVENTWGRVADINFHGWGPCPSDTRGWLVMDIEPGGGSSSALGYQGAGNATNMTLGYEDTRQPVAVLHEFGHALGFWHEFIRADWPSTGMTCTDDSSCTNYWNYGPTCVKVDASDPTGFCRNPAEGQGLSPLADFDSVMAATYVNNFTNGNTNGVANPIDSLSPWDVMGVQQIYGPKPPGSIVGLGGRCANISGGTTEFGHPLGAWTCVGQSNDTFVPLDDGSGTRLLKATISGVDECLNVQGGIVSPSSGTNLISWDCESGAENETFELTGMRLRAMGNMCVAATDTSAGSLLELRKCGAVSSALENWDLYGSSFRLSGTNLCATLPSETPTLGMRPSLQPCSLGSSTQTFTLAGGEVRMSDMCFNVFTGTTTEGNGIGMWDGCGWGNYNEAFYLTGPIRSMGQCMDMFGGVAVTGAQIGVYPCQSGAPNEEWDYHWQ